MSSIAPCPTLAQIIKMSQAGEVSVEKSPYKNSDVEETCPLSVSSPAVSETVCPIDDPTRAAEAIQEEHEELEEVAVGGAKAQGVGEGGGVGEVKKEAEKGDAKETENNKPAVTFNVGGEVRLRRHPPSRSQTIRNRQPQPRSVELRRQSLCNLRKGETGEMGSTKFRRALRRDSIYEIHPGWESIRKLSKVVGYVHKFCAHMQTAVEPPVMDPPTRGQPLYKGHGLWHQLKLL